MGEYLLLLVTTVLINNVLLSKFLGLCPFMGVSNKLDTALSMGLATTFVLTLSAMASWVVEHYMLIPLQVPFLRILSFIFHREPCQLIEISNNSLTKYSGIFTALRMINTLANRE